MVAFHALFLHADFLNFGVVAYGISVSAKGSDIYTCSMVYRPMIMFVHRTIIILLYMSNIY